MTRYRTPDTNQCRTSSDAADNRSDFRSDRTGISLIEFSAQQASLPPLTIQQAVDNAVRNYPSITVSQEQISAAAAAIDLAGTAYLPRVDGIAQVNRATRNNVFGLAAAASDHSLRFRDRYLGSNNFGTVWGSAIGGLVTWEPFDFGLRRTPAYRRQQASRLTCEATLEANAI